MKERSNLDSVSRYRKKTGRIKGAAAFLFLAVVLICLSAVIRGNAASSLMLDVSAINYENSTITFESANGDKKVYISDSKKKTWEEIPSEFVGGFITVDISWISPTVNYQLTFKGDKSTDIGSILIPKQVTNLKVSYKANALTPVAFTNAGTRTIQWRKNNSSIWQIWNKTTKNEDLSYLFVNGATLYFRLAPENGTSISDSGTRPSKEAVVKIPAKSAAPTIKVDASAFTIPLKSGMAYRFVTIDADGNITVVGADWTTINSTKTYNLSQFAKAALYSGTDITATSEVSIQFKTNATASAQESKITTVTIPAQEKAPELNTIGASLAYTSSKSLELTIRGASETTPYEYCIVKADDVTNPLPFADLKWSSVASSNAISLTKTNAPVGSHIYVRKKSVASLGDEKFALASDAKELTSAQNGVVYPDGMEMKNIKTMIAPAGTIHTGTYGKTAEFAIYSYTKTTVSSVTFQNIYGNSVGKVECTSTVAKNTSATEADGSDAYIITTKITSTAELDSKSSALEEKLYAKITLANGEEIVSTDLAGVNLYLYPATKVNNPSTYDKTSYGKYFDSYMSAFNRVYKSNETDDDTYFKFILDLGTKYVMDGTTIGTATSTPTEISKVTYDAYVLNTKTFTKTAAQSVDDAEAAAYASTPGDAMIYYEDYTNSDGKAARRAYITIHADRFEKDASITKTNSKLPFVITLNNKEVLFDNVHMTLTETATLNDAPIAWTITEGSLTESTTKNTYDENGNLVSSVTTPVNSYVLKLTKSASNYNVGVSDVTWGGTSILYEASVSGNTITITLSNAKINKLKADANGAGFTTSTNNVIIKLSNGFELSTGCKLTILKAASN